MATNTSSNAGNNVQTLRNVWNSKVPQEPTKLKPLTPISSYPSSEQKNKPPMKDNVPTEKIAKETTPKEVRKNESSITSTKESKAFENLLKFIIDDLLPKSLSLK